VPTVLVFLAFYFAFSLIARLLGSRAPDERFWYRPDEVREFLDLIGEGRLIYGLTELTLCTIFALIYGLLLGWLIVLSERLCADRKLPAALGWFFGRSSGRLLLGAVCTAVVTNWIENAILTALTATFWPRGFDEGRGLSDTAVWEMLAWIAAVLTALKWLSLAAVLVGVLARGLAACVGLFAPSQRPEVRGQRSEVRGQESGDTAPPGLPQERR
jgi:hypothetical protein